MDQSVLEMATDLVKSQIQAGGLTPEDTQQVLRNTHTQLMTLQARGESGGGTGSSGDSLPADWRKSISQHAITCLECGVSFKQLSIRHFRAHDLDAQSYRNKYGIPRTTPLAAKATTARRRQAVQQHRPWEKTPRLLATHEAQELAETASNRVVKQSVKEIVKTAVDETVEAVDKKKPEAAKAKAKKKAATAKAKSTVVAAVDETSQAVAKRSKKAAK